MIVDAAIAEHLEVLHRVLLGGPSVSEGIGEARAFNRLLGYPVYRLRRRDAGNLVDGRRNVDHVPKLGSRLPLGLDPRRPANHHAVAGATKVRSNLLGPAKRRIRGNRPARSKMRVGAG